MRYMVAILTLCCCSVTGYSQEATEAPKEVTTADEVSTTGADQQQSEEETASNCGCGKPK